jgi:peptide chain release factor subunit 1
MFDDLIELFKEDLPPIGCIVMSGESASLYTLCGTEVKKHAIIDVSLPSKHGRGGQSKLRFERLAEEARHNYIMKVYELILRTYQNVPLIIGGPAYLKDRLSEKLSALDRIKILKVVDIQYDKKQGLHELLSKCADIISSIQLEKEKEYVQSFLNLVHQHPDLIAYGDKNVQYCLENGLIKQLLVHIYVGDDDSLQTECDKYGTELVIISDLLPEANQLYKAFGGKVAILRYPTVITFDEENEDSGSFEW